MPVSAAHYAAALVIAPEPPPAIHTARRLPAYTRAEAWPHVWETVLAVVETRYAA